MRLLWAVVVLVIPLSTHAQLARQTCPGSSALLAARKALGVLVSLVALAGVVATVVLVTRRIDQRPRTDDGYLQADLVHMASKK